MRVVDLIVLRPVSCWGAAAFLAKAQIPTSCCLPRLQGGRAARPAVSSYAAASAPPEVDVSQVDIAKLPPWQDTGTKPWGAPMKMCLVFVAAEVAPWS